MLRFYFTDFYSVLVVVNGSLVNSIISFCLFLFYLVLLARFRWELSICDYFKIIKKIIQYFPGAYRDGMKKH